MASTPNIFGANLAQVINQALGTQLLPAVLIKTVTARDPNNPTKMIETPENYECRGFTDTKNIKTSDGTLVRRNANVISLLGASLPEPVNPEPGDRITIEGETFTIAEKGVKRDPAGAVYECEAV